MIRRLLLACALVLLAAPTLPAERGFTLEDGLAMNQFQGRMPIDLTHDGRWLTYGLQSQLSGLDAGSRHYLPTGIHRMMAGTEIHVTGVDKSVHRNLTEGWGTSWAPRWSPDGARLAFFSDRSGKPLLYVWTRETDVFQAIEGAVVRTFFGFEVPAWSPDGRYVFYRALSKNHEAHYATDPAGWPWEEALRSGPETPDETIGAESSFVEVLDARRTVSETKSAVKSPAAQTTAQNRRGRGIIDVVRADTTTGEVTRLMRGYAIRTLYPSPDGRKLLVSVQLGVEEAGAQQPLFALYTVPALGSGTPHGFSDDDLYPVVEELRGGYGISMSWSPDSERLAYVSVGPLARGDAFVVDVSSSRSKNLTEMIEANLGDDLESYDPPLWTPDGRYLLWVHRGEVWRIATDGSGAILLTENLPSQVACLGRPTESGRLLSRTVVAQTFSAATHRAGFARIDVESGEAVQVLEQDRQYSGMSTCRFQLEVNEATGAVVFRSESSTEGADLHATDADLKSTQRVTDINPGLANVDLGDLHMLDWTLDNGVEARGTLLLPAGTSKADPVPLIVWIYGGSRPSAHARRFGLGRDPATDNPRFFTGRGYGVLFPDLPLDGPDSEKTYDPLAAHARAVLPAVDAAVATGFVDPKRLGIFGHSYGGYGVNATITQTDRFAAAVASTGSANLASYFLHSAFRRGSTGWFETGQGRMGVPLWENPQRYVENSPVFHLDKVTTPLLLVHSEDDDAYQQSVEMYGGLSRLGKDVVLATYKDAHHAYGAWSNDKLRDFWDRVLGWFDQYL